MDVDNHLNIDVKKTISLKMKRFLEKFYLQ